MTTERQYWNPIYRGVDPKRVKTSPDEDIGPFKIRFDRRDAVVDSTNPGLTASVTQLLTLRLISSGATFKNISTILDCSKSQAGDFLYDMRKNNKDETNTRLFEKAKWLGLEYPLAFRGLALKILDAQKRDETLKKIDIVTEFMNDRLFKRAEEKPWGTFPESWLDLKNEESVRSILIRKREEKQRRTMEGLTEAVKAYTAEFERGRLVGTVYTGQAENLYRFTKRLEEQKLTREERQDNHFCVYFAAFDPQTKEVFIGHHIKSGLWLFNGGHIDLGETPREAALREIGEEWGVTDYQLPDLPNLLTITDINNGRVKCKTHWDIWYFLPFDKNSFSPDANKLRTEFYKNMWCPIDSAQKLITDPSNLKAIEVLKGL